jgi:hypothetical protein
MAKCILFAGQSLAVEMFTYSSGTQTPHADTHMWNGSGWVAPTGDGAITYANGLRSALQEHIYLVNAAVGNTPLTNYGSSSNTDYWACPTGSLVCNAISQTQAALGSVSGLSLDRIEWWHGQHESYTQGWGDMYGAYLGYLNSLISTLRAALGNDFRFCIWPVGKVHTGSTAPVIRAQMAIANASSASQNNIEPGPASYDRGYRDGVHLANAAEYLWMGIRGARNAMSYFVAKANAADTIPHYGSGPVIESLMRHPNGQSTVMFAKPRVKNGFCLIPGAQWPTNDTTWTTGWAAAWAGGSANPPITGAQIMGGWIKLHSSWLLNNAVWVSYQGERTADASSSIYDTNMQWGDQGQPMLPHALESMASN